jgi:acetyl esterase/lipase
VLSTLKEHEPTITERKLGGVPVLDIKPKGWTESRKVIVYLHGGAYTMSSARSSLIKSVPAAAATGYRIISVDYTVAPRGKWQAVTDEVIAVVQALIKDGHSLKDIALFGDSAGGGLAPGSVLKMRDNKLGMPAAIVVWSPWSDITETGDTYVTLKHAEPTYLYETVLKHGAAAYAEAKDQKHPYVSPVYGDFSKGFPPTLIQGGTKEIFVSNFVRQYQALDSAGQTVKLDLYEGMPHVFQGQLPDAPESKLAFKKMRAFLLAHLGK